MPTCTHKGLVVFLIRLKPGAAGPFLAAHARIHEGVAGVRGHIVDQVCRRRDGDDSWLITSEWESLECFLEWERTEAYRELAKPLRECIASAQSMKFNVIEETRPARPAARFDATNTEKGIYTWFDAA